MESKSHSWLGREESDAEMVSHDHTAEKASCTELKAWIKYPEKNEATEGQDNAFAPLRLVVWEQELCRDCRRQELGGRA